MLKRRMVEEDQDIAVLIALIKRIGKIASNSDTIIPLIATNQCKGCCAICLLEECQVADPMFWCDKGCIRVKCANHPLFQMHCNRNCEGCANRDCIYNFNFNDQDFSQNL